MRRPFYIDANILIAAFEMSDVNSDNAGRVLDAVGIGSLVAVTSELTLAEVLPKPIEKNDEELIHLYERFVGADSVLDVAPVTRCILVGAARIRARTRRVKLPDALHLATALDRGCVAFLTSDLGIMAHGDVQIVRLTSTSLEEIEKLTA